MLNKLYTSYFDKINCLIDLGFCNFVSIAGKTPNFFLYNNPSMFHQYTKLAPKYYWWIQWKENHLDNQWYIERYYETVLNKLDPIQVLNELGDNCVLLCYEKSGEFCHRRIVADWFKRKLNIDVEEIKGDSNE